jgi:hypothetical protein
MTVTPHPAAGTPGNGRSMKMRWPGGDAQAHLLLAGQRIESAPNAQLAFPIAPAASEPADGKPVLRRADVRDPPFDRLAV